MSGSQQTLIGTKNMLKVQTPRCSPITVDCQTQKIYHVMFHGLCWLWNYIKVTVQPIKLQTKNSTQDLPRLCLIMPDQWINDLFLFIDLEIRVAGFTNSQSYPNKQRPEYGSQKIILQPSERILNFLQFQGKTQEPSCSSHLQNIGSLQTRFSQSLFPLWINSFFMDGASLNSYTSWVMMVMTTTPVPMCKCNIYILHIQGARVCNIKKYLKYC